MKRIWFAMISGLLVAGTVAWSGQKPPAVELDFRQEVRNPVSHLRLNNAPGEFQFAVVSDRTGGHRPRVFSKAVEQLNLLQPEFVVSVGDLIEGYTEDRGRLAAEWREFQGYVSRLEMPFFYVPGNHDISNLPMEQLWKEKFGRRYYDFVYRDVLFLLLNSEDPPGKDGGAISDEQLAFLKQSLVKHKDVRWTLVFLHKPMWYMRVIPPSWLAVEELLKGRKHTVFAGHVHKYQKFLRNGGMSYYMLATTGGGSRLRGTLYGEFDHFVWVTMKPEGPVLANLMLDGIYPENMQRAETAEEGAPQYNRKPAYPVTGVVTLNGKPVAQAYVVFEGLPGKDGRPPRADAFTDAEGRYALSTYEAGDGAAVGEYAVTVVARQPLSRPDGTPGPNLLPEKYAHAETSGLKAAVTAKRSTFDISLTSN